MERERYLFWFGIVVNWIALLACRYYLRLRGEPVTQAQIDALASTIADRRPTPPAREGDTTPHEGGNKTNIP